VAKCISNSRCASIQRRTAARALRGARADQHVRLVDDEHDVARLAALGEDARHARLELAALLGARDQ
jgi:hypothetical protein